MEKEIENSETSVSETLNACANALSDETDMDGITGVMYGIAISILSQEWICGEELKQWHNQIIQCL